MEHISGLDQGKIHTCLKDYYPKIDVSPFPTFFTSPVYTVVYIIPNKKLVYKTTFSKSVIVLTILWQSWAIGLLLILATAYYSTLLPQLHEVGRRDADISEFQVVITGTGTCGTCV